MWIMQPRQMVVLAFATIIVVVAGIVLVSYDAEKHEVIARRAHVIELVHLGMDIDEAVAALRAEGYRPGAKYKPTGDDGAFYFVHVPLRSKVPLSHKVKSVLGVPVTDPVYVTIEAELEGVITRIE